MGRERRGGRKSGGSAGEAEVCRRVAARQAGFDRESDEGLRAGCGRERRLLEFRVSRAGGPAAMAEGDRDSSGRQAAGASRECTCGSRADGATTGEKSRRGIWRDGIDDRVGVIRSRQPFSFLEARVGAVRRARWESDSARWEFGSRTEYAFAAFGKSGDAATDAGFVFHRQAGDAASDFAADGE